MPIDRELPRVVNALTDPKADPLGAISGCAFRALGQAL